MDSVKCPRCNSYTVDEPFTALGTVTPASDTYRSIRCYYKLAVDDMSIVVCRACDEFFLTKARRAVWPLNHPSAPESVPEKVREAYEDARRAHAAGSNIGALMAARTALLRFQRDKKAANFKELVERQVITPAIYGGVDQLRLWAAVAGHDDIETDTFDDQEVQDILDYLGTALEAAYTHQARVDEYVSRTDELRNRSNST